MGEVVQIVLLTREYPPDTSWGGCAVINHALARGLAARGHQAHVICQAVRRAKDYSDEGVFVHRVGNNPRRYSALARIDYSIAARLKLQQLFRTHQPQIVQADFWSAEGFLYSFGLGRRAPLVVGTQSGPSDLLQTETYSGTTALFQWKLLSALANFTARRADKVVFESQDNYLRLQPLLNVPPRRSAVVPLGVDTSVYRFTPSEIRRDMGIPASSPLLLTVGRLERRKGQHVLLQALPAVAKRFPEVRLLLIGRDSRTAPDGGSFKEWLESQAREAGLVNNLVLVESVPLLDLVRLYSTCDVFVMPSLEEGFGLAAVEAMACGKPIAATATGIVPELGLDGSNGIQVPAGDPGALGLGIIKMLELSVAGKQAISARNRRIVEDGFSIGRYVQAMIQQYEQLVGVGFPDGP